MYKWPSWSAITICSPQGLKEHFTNFPCLSLTAMLLTSIKQLKICYSYIKSHPTKILNYWINWVTLDRLNPLHYNLAIADATSKFCIEIGLWILVITYPCLSGFGFRVQRLPEIFPLPTCTFCIIFCCEGLIAYLG